MAHDPLDPFRRDQADRHISLPGAKLLHWIRLCLGVGLMFFGLYRMMAVSVEQWIVIGLGAALTFEAYFGLELVRLYEDRLRR